MSDNQNNTKDRQKEKLISFIVTVYNIPYNMLIECVESILHLSPNSEDMEIIVVDDGSKTPALSTLERYQDNIIYIRQSNKGLSEARNTGLQMARGRYVQFVDGDDYLVKVAYEHCLDIARYEDPDMVLFSFSKTKSANVPFLFNSPVTGIEYMLNNNIRASACAYLFRRDILGSLRFSPGIVCEDEEFTPLLFLRAQRVFTTNAEAYFYRRRKGSITDDRSDYRKIVKRLTDVFNTLCKLKDVTTRLPEDARQALQRRIAQLSMDYLYNTAILTKSMHQLDEATESLRGVGLYPLPDKQYTWKYSAFRKMMATKAGRYLLIMKGVIE